MLLRCYYAFVLPIHEYCFPVWGSAAECHLQLHERQGYSVPRRFPDQTFLSLCHRRRVAALCMCCTRLIRTQIIVCLVSYHLLLSKFDIPKLRLQLIYWSLKYRCVERPILQGVSCRPRLVCGITFPALCLTPKR